MTGFDDLSMRRPFSKNKETAVATRNPKTSGTNVRKFARTLNPSNALVNDVSVIHILFFNLHVLGNTKNYYSLEKFAQMLFLLQTYLQVIT